MVSHKGKRVLVVEPSEGVQFSSLQASLAWAHVDAIEVLNKLPVDKRHNAKIDYPALHELLGKAP
jgi:hypothetical protein